MNVFKENKYFSILLGSFLFISCEKEQCYSQYYAEWYGYKRGSEVIVIKKYDENLNEIDNKDTINALIGRGYVYNGSSIVNLKGYSTDKQFLERVRKIGGYTYCY